MISEKTAERYGFRIIDTELISSRSAPYYDPQLLSAALLSLC
jgi:hypothetical protein